MLTIDEAINALDALEPRLAADARAAGRRHVLTPRQLRYLANTDRGVLPALRVSGSRHSARYLYRATDLVLLRLLLRVSAHRAPWQAWGAVVYLGEALREAIARRRPVALVFEGGAHAALYPVQAPAAQTEDAFSLPACTDGVDREMARALRRRQRDELWDGCRHVPARELAAAVGV